MFALLRVLFNLIPLLHDIFEFCFESLSLIWSVSDSEAAEESLSIRPRGLSVDIRTAERHQSTSDVPM
jgi:hypothetical protein